MIYTPKQFEALAKDFLKMEEDLLTWKAGEYTDSVDRLKNFRQVAEWLGQAPAEVALCYLMKHIQSISLAVKSGRFNWAWMGEEGEGMKQRIADARNYLLLLAACLDEHAEGEAVSHDEKEASHLWIMPLGLEKGYTVHITQLDGKVDKFHVADVKSVEYGMGIMAVKGE